MRVTELLMAVVFLLVTQASLAQYAVHIELPECDFVIRSADDWVKVNDPAFTVICVAPGSYTYNDIGVVKLTRSGTPENPRYLRWYDPENPDDFDTHVVDIPADKQAVIPQFSIMSDYWVIDRIVARGGRRQNTLENGASRNVLNRMLIEGGSATLLLQFYESSHNVLQHSVLRDTVAMPGKDSYVIYFHKSEAERIIDNEIYNYGGGIQQSPLSRSNHVVYGNEMYTSDELYTDCMGNRNKKGKCACSEGIAIVLKGVNRPGASFRIENNLIYGHRPQDKYCMGSGNPGTAIVLDSGGNPTHNVVVTGNVVLNTIPYNIYLGKFVKNIQITDNIIGYGGYGVTNVYGDNVTITDNIFVENVEDYHSGPKAVRTIYKNNRRMLESEITAKCFQVKKFTAPHISCLAELK